MKTQDPKYDIENGRLVNAETREPIPEDEPVFILRGKDIHTLATLEFYSDQCEDVEHVDAVNKRIRDFRDFRNTHVNDMNEPD